MRKLLDDITILLSQWLYQLEEIKRRERLTPCRVILRPSRRGIRYMGERRAKLTVIEGGKNSDDGRNDV